MSRKVRDELARVTAELRQELIQRANDGAAPTDEDRESILVIDSDAPVHLNEDDVMQLNDHHFRCNLGCGFGLDVVLLGSSSLAFRSFDGSFLDLRDGKSWPGSLFNPVVGQA